MIDPRRLLAERMASESRDDVGGRLDMLDRPKDTYKDVEDELTRALHLSLLAPTYKEKVVHCKNFITLALEFLPDSEAEYRDSVRKFLEETTQPIIKTTPKYDADSQPLYEVNSNLGRGFTTQCHIHDITFIYQNIQEAINEETYNVLAPKRAEIVQKLVKHKVLSFRREYYEEEDVGEMMREEGGLDISFLRRRLSEEGDVE